MIELKCARENLGLVFARKLVGWLKGKRKPRLAELAAGVFFELNTQGRHYVERCVESRHLAEYLHHAPVIFHSVQPRPRQNILPGFRIAILRLVRSEEHTSELQSLTNLVCRLLLEKKNDRRQRPASRRSAR